MNSTLGRDSGGGRLVLGWVGRDSVVEHAADWRKRRRSLGERRFISQGRTAATTSGNDVYAQSVIRPIHAGVAGRVYHRNLRGAETINPEMAGVSIGGNGSWDGG